MRGMKTLWFIGVFVVLAIVVALQPVRAQVRPRAPRPDFQMPFMWGGSRIGISLGEVRADDVKTLTLPKQEGAVVQEVQPNSPASSAGLREKDVVILYDGERVRSARQLTRLVAETPEGRKVAIAVMRDGRRVDLEITPEAGRGAFLESDRIKEMGDQVGRMGRDLALNLPDLPGIDVPGVAGRGRLGVTVQNLTPELASYFGVKSGVLVSSVIDNSAAANAGLKAGDVITAIDGRSVATSGELVRALAGDADREISLTVVRDKKEQTLKATLGAQHERAPAPRSV